MKLWINNTDGRPDAVLTMTLIGFLVIILKVLLAGSTIVWNGDTVSFGDIDAATIGAVLTPTLGAYCARRYTNAKYPCSHEEEDYYENEGEEE